MTSFEQAKRQAEIRRHQAQGGPASEYLTVRDYFAAKAMPMAWDYARRVDCGSVDGPKPDPTEVAFDLYVDPEGEDDDCGYVASLAYRMADAMMKAREA